MKEKYNQIKRLLRELRLQRLLHEQNCGRKVSKQWSKNGEKRHNSYQRRKVKQELSKIAKDKDLGE